MATAPVNSTIRAARDMKLYVQPVQYSPALADNEIGSASSGTKIGVATGENQPGDWLEVRQTTVVGGVVQNTRKVYVLSSDVIISPFITPTPDTPPSIPGPSPKPGFPPISINLPPFGGSPTSPPTSSPTGATNQPFDPATGPKPGEKKGNNILIYVVVGALVVGGFVTFVIVMVSKGKKEKEAT